MLSSIVENQFGIMAQRKPGEAHEAELEFVTAREAVRGYVLVGALTKSVALLSALFEIFETVPTLTVCITKDGFEEVFVAVKVI